MRVGDMVKRYWRLALAAVLFLAGVDIVLSAFTATETLWLLIPGCLLLVVTYPLLHAYYYQLRHGYGGSREEEALREAKNELRQKGIPHDDAKE